VRLSNDPRHTELLSRALEITRDFTTPEPASSLSALWTRISIFSILALVPQAEQVSSFFLRLQAPPDVGPHVLVQEIGNGCIDVANNHKGHGCHYLACE